MSETSATPADQPKTFWQKASRWIFAVCGVVIMIGGAMKIYKAASPGLPNCDSATTKTAITDIYKEKNVTLTSLTDMKSITDTSSEKTCQAHLETAGETATVSYRLFFQDGSSKVMITKVDAKAR